MKKAIYYLTRNGKYRNAGEVLSKVVTMNNMAAAYHEDVDIMGAPGECHDIVHRGVLSSCYDFLMSFDLPIRRALRYINEIKPKSKSERFRYMLDTSLLEECAGELNETTEALARDRRIRLSYEKSGVYKSHILRNKKIFWLCKEDKVPEHVLVLKVEQPDHGFQGIFQHPFFDTIFNLGYKGYTATDERYRMHRIGCSETMSISDNEYMVLTSRYERVLMGIAEMSKFFHIRPLVLHEIEALSVSSKTSACNNVTRPKWDEWNKYTLPKYQESVSVI